MSCVPAGVLPITSQKVSALERFLFDALIEIRIAGLVALRYPRGVQRVIKKCSIFFCWETQKQLD